MYQTFIIGISVIAFMASCGNTPEKNNTPSEDLEAKRTIQGFWVDELEGNCVLRAKGDTIFYKKGVTDPDYCVLKFTAINARYYCDLKTENFDIN